MPALVAVETAFPKNYYTQEQIIEALKDIWKEKVKNTKRLQSIQENVLVGGRHLSMPLEDYFKGKTFGERNHHFIQTAVDLFEKAASQILKKYNLNPKDISSLWSNTVTGFAIPSLEARLMNRLAFPQNTKRVPLLGLGCMAGVAGINRVTDYLKAYPHEAVLFLSVELCSLTFQVEDISVANLVSTGLFGDGAAAVLMVGDEHPLAHSAPLQVLSSESVFFPDSEDVMGWDVGESGLKIILNKNVPDVTENQLAGPLKNFLKTHNLQLADLQNVLAHPGGPKVLMAMEKILDLPQKGLTHSWDSLNERGNMSSVSVLDIFQRHLKEYESQNRQAKGKMALSLAMGPAFSAEIGLLRWN
jgi:alkylresorcinol/alkylpyrone synthase